jgi:tRNA pseudouridine13 synthase
VTLPRANGEAVLSARFRLSPEDFVVEELPGFEPSGAGEHLLLTIEKRGLTTPAVAKRLAAWAGIAEVDVGYAGLKDRHAVTRQRFSVRLPKKVAPDLAALVGDDASLRVLESHWHARKLPRGALAGNAFVLVLREVRGERAAVEARLAAIAAGGLPNYFGEQRFGRSGDNVEQARRLFAGARVKREERSILLSAARSELFNAVLAARVAAGNWAEGVDGEVWMLEGTHSVFGPEVMTDELRERARRLDIHPTGPLWGRGALRSAGEAAAIEQAAVEAHADLRAGLESAGMNQERRALRVRVADLGWEWLADDALRLSFALPPGSYATGLLAELGDCVAG